MAWKKIYTCWQVRPNNIDHTLNIHLWTLSIHNNPSLYNNVLNKSLTTIFEETIDIKWLLFWNDDFNEMKTFWNDNNEISNEVITLMKWLEWNVDSYEMMTLWLYTLLSRLHKMTVNDICGGIFIDWVDDIFSNNICFDNTSIENSIFTWR